MYLVFPMGDGAIPDRAWYRKHRTECQNSVCRHLGRLPIKSMEINYFEDTALLSFINGVECHLVNQQMSGLLEPHFSACFKKGIVTVNGSPLQDWVSYFDTHPITIRGDLKSQCTKCKVCNMISYFAHGKLYALRRDIAGRKIAGTNMGGLLVDQELHSIITSRKWKKVSIKPLNIIDEPIDGFPCDLSSITPEQERSPQF
ncbi:MAG TPA: hypothetical protein PLN21_06235 [Gemmatales bacterium]|nr:hypothetical protein [Gemmatales bacterium]